MGPRGSAIVCAALAIVCAIVLREDFQRHGKARPLTATELAISRGEEVFRREAMCVVCHAVGGHGGQIAPLDHIATRVVQWKGDRERARQFFYDHVVDPSKHPGPRGNRCVGGQCCPSYRKTLGEDKIRDLGEFLLTLE